MPAQPTARQSLIAGTLMALMALYVLWLGATRHLTVGSTPAMAYAMATVFAGASVLAFTQRHPVGRRIGDLVASVILLAFAVAFGLIALSKEGQCTSSGPLWLPLPSCRTGFGIFAAFWGLVGIALLRRWIRRFIKPPSAYLLLAALLPAVASSPVHAQRAERTDRALERTLRGLINGFGGDVGIYARQLRTGAFVAMNADSVFPTASIVKVPILLTLYDQVEQKKLDLASIQKRPASLEYKYVETSDVVAYMATGDSLPLSELAFLMLTVSDNVASLWIQALVGGGAAVNEWLAAHGFAQTRVNSRTPGREEARAKYGWGQTTPREIAGALVMIREGRAVSPRASEAMYRSLTKTFWDENAVSQIPPTVTVASKQGFVDRSRSEVLLVNAPAGDYVLAVFTKNLRDTTYASGNEAHRLIRAVSRAVYAHWNPADRWRPMP